MTLEETKYLILELYTNQGWSLNQIAEHVRVPRTTCGRYLKELGGHTRDLSQSMALFSKSRLQDPSRNPKLKAKLERQGQIKEGVIDLYLQGKSQYEISLTLQVSQYDVKDILQTSGHLLPKGQAALLQSKANTLNSDYFDSIDTEEKAYWLGLLYADGSIHKDGSQVTLSLQFSDYELVQKFASIFQSKIFDYDIPDKRTGKSYRRATTTVFCKYLGLQLISKGIFINKSNIDDFKVLDQTPESLYRHFVRGFFDGDGYIWDKGKTVAVALYGRKGMVEGLRDKAKEELRDFKLSPCDSLYRLEVNGKKALSFSRWIYQHSSVWLPRKREKAEYLLGVAF